MSPRPHCAPRSTTPPASQRRRCASASQRPPTTLTVAFPAQKRRRLILPRPCGHSEPLPTQPDIATPNQQHSRNYCQLWCRFLARYVGAASASLPYSSLWPFLSRSPGIIPPNRSLSVPGASPAGHAMPHTPLPSSPDGSPAPHTRLHALSCVGEQHYPKLAHWDQPCQQVLPSLLSADRPGGPHALSMSYGPLPLPGAWFKYQTHAPFGKACSLSCLFRFMHALLFNY